MRRWTKRLVTAALGALVLLAGAVALGPAFIRPGTTRLAIVGSPADVGLAYETVAFPAADQPLTLRAWWMPARDAKAAVILVHGGGDDNRASPHADGLGLARDLVAHGYGVLALDLRNFGDSDAAPGNEVTFGDAESYDVIGAVRFLAARDPRLRFAVLGWSMGGSTALYAAARERRLEAVITEGAFAEAPSIGPRFVHASVGLPMLLATATVWSAQHLHGLPLERGRAADVAGAIAPRPVLVIHDDADPIVPVAHAHRLAAAISSARTWVTHGDGGHPEIVAAQGPWGTHTQCYRLHRDEYVRRVVEFLDRAFAPSRPEARVGRDRS